MRSKYFLILACAFFFNSCASTEPELKFDKPPAQVLKPKPQVTYNKGSLYSRKGPSLFADKKDLQVGDIIQVVIDESLTSNTSNKRELTNTSAEAMGGGLVTPATGNNVPLNSTVQSVANKINSFGGVQFNSNSNSSFKGKVKANADESFSTTLSVIIEETYQNGNYYIKGSKEMLIDEQKQEIIISGVIRPYDISPDNSIKSSQVANLKVLYKKDGEEQDVMHQPWGTKLLKMLWPF
ncbi:flagellar basal body L-ring protein FlgH [Arcobacter sp. KX21116]|jgi:flagellar L-ring protein precursor FlgH|uniref:flagellar basal body L-ring protein FlgH n=1 Tax=Arcobacter iocasae TaxID=2906515 RepID=UPI0035D4D97F|tara:strand:- start:138638 stop:139351 length:714 start_codon:yes stop_codon:yes gene_type:complete